MLPDFELQYRLFASFLRHAAPFNRTIGHDTVCNDIELRLPTAESAMTLDYCPFGQLRSG